MNISKAIVLTGILAAALAPATVHAHATYNISGYGSGLGGSTNGADGQPADATATWTNGPAEGYVGTLPVNWYCGLHNATQVRTIQTGGAGTPPSGSLAQQVASYNTANDPDLPTDRVIAVGGLSWTDPDNANQGWGHGLDYGLIHLTPLATILAGGPARLTITLTDDPSDSPSVRLAYALYRGWDTSATSLRHQTFVTNPAPVDNPLGSAGLTLVDFAVATSAGAVLSRSYDIDPNEEHYTILVGALGGVAGQYQLTAGIFPNAGLGECQGDLVMALADADDDGVLDGADACADTPLATAVDPLGCSRAQFCGGIDVSTKSGQKACKKADWGNDEPLLSKKTSDCLYDKKNTQTCIPTDIP
jgi:hypothetical protein